MKAYKNVILLICLLLMTSSCTYNDSNEKTDRAESAEATAAVPPSKAQPYEAEFRNYLDEDGSLELPVQGAAGYTAVALRLREGNSLNAEIIETLKAGQGFQIIEENNGWWKINVGGKDGWVNHSYCLINLPDVIPSIVYNNDNAYSSKLKSSGYDIPNITGEQLYQAYGHNSRLNQDEYIVPVLYSMAPKICKAQQEALSEGNTLIIYEGFRPYDVQRLIVNNLSALASENASVAVGIKTPPWSMPWFVSTGVSNHQKGYAIDVSLGKVLDLSFSRF